MPRGAGPRRWFRLLPADFFAARSDTKDVNGTRSKPPPTLQRLLSRNVQSAARDEARSGVLGHASWRAGTGVRCRVSYHRE